MCSLCLYLVMMTMLFTLSSFFFCSRALSLLWWCFYSCASTRAYAQPAVMRKVRKTQKERDRKNSLLFSFDIYEWIQKNTLEKNFHYLFKDGYIIIHTFFGLIYTHVLWFRNEKQQQHHHQHQLQTKIASKILLLYFSIFFFAIIHVFFLVRFPSR